MARSPRTPGSRAALESALIGLGLALLLGAAVAGFALGRASAPEGNGAVAAEETGTATTGATGTEGLTTVTGETETTGATTGGGTTTGGGETGQTGQTGTGGGTGEQAEGARVFETAGCGGCHTLSAANSSGTIGPNLDNIDLSSSEIENAVRTGPGAMPSFAGRLSDEEIEAVADYVENG
jgi:mono/diheme cytochrome c family protein